MAKIFLSHSSRDKPIVRRIANDLKSKGHDVWLDEYDIQVGDSIIESISKGILDADYLVVFLSAAAVQSKWVEKEWAAKYTEEMAAGAKKVLPVLLEECLIPVLLRDKKYADFRSGYLSGFEALEAALRGVASSMTPPLRATNHAPARTEVLSLVADRAVPLSKSLPKVLAFAEVAGHPELLTAIRSYLFGSDDPPDYSSSELPPYIKSRTANAYVFLKGELNLNYFGFGGDGDRAMDHIENSPDFRWLRVPCVWPITALEAKAAEIRPGTLLVWGIRAGDLDKTSKNPDRKFKAYFRSNTWQRLLDNIRDDVLQMLGTISTARA